MAINIKCNHKFIDSNFCLKCGWSPEDKNMKFNPLDGDRAKNAYIKQKSEKECAAILAAFNLGANDRKDGLNNSNPFSKSRDLNRYVGYENGYNNKK